MHRKNSIISPPNNGGTSSFRGRIVVGADDFGGGLKDAVVGHLRDVRGLEVQWPKIRQLIIWPSYDLLKVKDLGVDKYYESAARVARAVQAAGGGGGKGDAHTRGMLFCGTGIGVGIIANKFTGERARAFWQI